MKETIACSRELIALIENNMYLEWIESTPQLQPIIKSF